MSASLADDCRESDFKLSRFLQQMAVDKANKLSSSHSGTSIAVTCRRATAGSLYIVVQVRGCRHPLGSSFRRHTHHV